MANDRRLSLASLALLVACAFATPAHAGPPYLNDDPEPTDYRHYEIYAFAAGAHAANGWSGTTGIDFNYGATHDLQLTAVLPIEYDHASSGALISGAGNVELAAKLRILHQESFGWDVAVFPRLFLPSLSHRLGDDHASLLLPIFVGRDAGPWSTFGGAGCTLHRGGDARDFCQAGWALTREITPGLRLGGEVFHQGTDTKGARASSRVGLGAVYDVNENVHALASVNQVVGPGDEPRGSFYTSLLFTF